MSTGRSIPPAARQLAERLAELFDRDQQLAVALNEAGARLRNANEQLTAGLSTGALQAIYGTTGPALGFPAPSPAVLDEEQPIAALERVAHHIRSGFLDYQRRSDDRRVLGMDIGEANAQLIAAMIAAGFTEQQARHADVRALAAGVFRAVEPIAGPRGISDRA